MNRKVYILFLFLFLKFPNAIACECGPVGDLKSEQLKNYTDSKLVFIGKVTSFDNYGNYEFKIIELLKGNLKDSHVTGGIKNNCSLTPKNLKGVWLVYANIDDSGIIDMVRCDLSRSFDSPYIWFKDFKQPIPDNKNSSSISKEQQKANKTRKKNARSILKEEIQEIRKMK